MKTHHVVHSPDGTWKIKSGGASRASSTFEKQSDAIEHARTIARNAGSELFIHGRDGTIRGRNSYGKDPCPPRDKR
jgi:hypothetical protein